MKYVWHYLKHSIHFSVMFLLLQPSIPSSSYFSYVSKKSNEVIFIAQNNHLKYLVYNKISKHRKQTATATESNQTACFIISIAFRRLIQPWIKLVSDYYLYAVYFSHQTHWDKDISPSEHTNSLQYYLLPIRETSVWTKCVISNKRNKCWTIEETLSSVLLNSRVSILQTWNVCSCKHFCFC